MYARRWQYTECVAVLLEARATVDAVSDNAETPLTMACYWKHERCAALLIAAGASLHVRLHWRDEMLLDWAKRVHQQRRRLGNAPVLVVRAWLGAVRWSPQQHFLFPPGARARAVKLLLLGTRLVPIELWVQFIMPLAMYTPLSYGDTEYSL